MNSMDTAMTSILGPTESPTHAATPGEITLAVAAGSIFNQISTAAMLVGVAWAIAAVRTRKVWIGGVALPGGLLMRKVRADQGQG